MEKYAHDCECLGTSCLNTHRPKPTTTNNNNNNNNNNKRIVWQENTFEMKLEAALLVVQSQKNKT